MSDLDLCKLCGLARRPECQNGSVVVDDLHAKECRNLLKIRIDNWLKSYLTPELYQTPMVTSSPLYVPGEKRGHAVVNRTKDNLFIKGITWTAFKSHLRYALVGTGVSYKVINDSRLRDVFVGGEAYQNRPKALRDDIREVNNVIADLVGDQYDLVIIQLGILGYKNVAAPGVLREALLVRRETLNKPTWLFESSDRSICWEYSRDELVSSYVETNFEELVFESEGPQVEESVGIDIDGDEGAVGAPTEHLALVPDDEKVSGSVVGDDGDDLLAGMSDDPSAPSKKKWKGRR